MTKFFQNVFRMFDINAWEIVEKLYSILVSLKLFLRLLHLIISINTVSYKSSNIPDLAGSKSFVQLWILHSTNILYK